MQVDFTKCRLTKCPLAIRPNFTSTCSEEYRQLGSLSVLLTLPSQTDMHSNPNPDLNNDATQTQSWIQKTGSSHGIFLDAYQNSASVQVHAFQDKRAERGEGKSSRQVEIEWKSATCNIGDEKPCWWSQNARLTFQDKQHTVRIHHLSRYIDRKRPVFCGRQALVLTADVF